MELDSPEQSTLPISRCAIYTRQSIDNRSDFTSCQAQFGVCRNYLKSQQWLGWRWIEERFDDEGYSGATLDRPALQCLLEKVRRGEIDRVIAYSLDRLSRNVIDGLQLLQEFRQRGVALVVATCPELGSAKDEQPLQKEVYAILLLNPNIYPSIKTDRCPVKNRAHRNRRLDFFACARLPKGHRLLLRYT